MLESHPLTHLLTHCNENLPSHLLFLSYLPANRLHRLRKYIL